MLRLSKKYLVLSMICSAVSIPVYAVSNMVALDDGELSNETGQALLTMAFTNPSGNGTGNGYLDYGYYKLGLEAKMELNANIKTLQLGCGGINGAGGCDIDMSNVSLSGPADGKVTSSVVSDNGTPTWSTSRANTSAVLTNPFIEFAIKNPDNAATREIVGFRLSAEEILGYLSAGTANVANPTDGIKSFSGYLKVAQTPVSASTQQAMFGTTSDQLIYAKITALGNNRTVTTNVNGMTQGSGSYTTPPSSAYNNSWGINVPSQSVNFNFPQTAVTGNRMSQLNLVVRDVPIPTIAIGADSGALLMRMDEGILGLANNPVFYMGASGTTAAGCAATINTSNCSYITNLKANVTVKQNFNLIHNLPITSGGYLSLQSVALRWPGSASAYTYNLTDGSIVNVADNYTTTSSNLILNSGDIAQPGWWMSFADPLDFGALNPTTGIPMQDVLPQIATFITDYLSENNISLGFFEAVGAGLGAPIYKGIGNIQLANNARAVMVLENLLLDGNQKPVSNCWGNLKFC
ncbi:MAG: hypothetical protein LKF82_00765 [Acinetobacter populi]|jgi:hypothetical protein|uniref:hypothetical protein n=1 Tax=Acinetobacter populi TaxID=1582270 RepID=UPI0023529D4D|nr:hypothetical protein [Acinetobacter populi]MCH4246362.1 hypothetical protein [Acinetobacter populi]